MSHPEQPPAEVSPPADTREPTSEENKNETKPQQPPPTPESIIASLPWSFGEEMAPYQLHTENFRWHEAEPGTYTRGLWGGEMYQERRSGTTGRYVGLVLTQCGRHDYWYARASSGSA